LKPAALLPSPRWDLMMKLCIGLWQVEQTREVSKYFMLISNLLNYLLLGSQQLQLWILTALVKLSRLVAVIKIPDCMQTGVCIRRLFCKYCSSLDALFA
jgi:hypothetical protein